MTCLITKLGGPLMEHWRVLVVEGDKEIYHDSAPSEERAKALLVRWLKPLEPLKVKPKRKRKVA